MDIGSDPTFKIYTLGCKVNQYDSQVIREQLQRAGLNELSDGQKANYYIINTCTVTDNADKQSRYLIRRSIRENPLAKIIVAGCYAHSNADDIRRINGVNLILDNDNKFRIVKFLFPRRKTNISHSFQISDFKGHTRAFVKIQDGCNNFCSFCKVPYVRGRSRSRDFDLIIDEIKRLRDKGYKEIVLTGICLGDYGKDLDESTKKNNFDTCSNRVLHNSLYKRTDLVDLINEIEEIEGIFRIRLSSIEARDISDNLVDKMKNSKKICPHLHIPFQSGDNKTLKLMNRKDTREDYLGLARKLRRNIKDISITADIMIGFPGEDEKRFLNTLDFLKKVKPARAHIFTFQPRDGTALSNYKNQIPTQALKQRFVLLKSLTDKLALEFRKKFLNRRLTVLFEDKKSGFWRGYSQNYLLTYLKVNGKLNINNQLVKVKIKNIGISNLYAEIEKYTHV